VLELAGAGLGDFNIGNERENNVGRVSLLEVGFNAECIRSVDENTSMLGSDDRFDDGGQVVDIGQGFYAENDIVVCIFAGRGFFGSTNN